VINGAGDKPNRHDVLTDATDGTAFPAGEDPHLQELDEQQQARPLSDIPTASASATMRP